MMAQSVTGPHAEQTLATLPVELTTWDDWLKRHPNSQVLWTRASGSRNDNTEPYAHYLSNDRLNLPGETDRRAVTAKNARHGNLE